MPTFYKTDHMKRILALIDVRPFPSDMLRSHKQWLNPWHTDINRITLTGLACLHHQLPYPFLIGNRVGRVLPHATMARWAHQPQISSIKRCIWKLVDGTAPKFILLEKLHALIGSLLWNMYVCMYACLFVCLYVCMFVWLYVCAICIQAYTLIQSYVNLTYATFNYEYIRWVRFTECHSCCCAVAMWPTVFSTTGNDGLHGMRVTVLLLRVLPWFLSSGCKNFARAIEVSVDVATNLRQWNSMTCIPFMQAISVSMGKWMKTGQRMTETYWNTLTPINPAVTRLLSDLLLAVYPWPPYCIAAKKHNVFYTSQILSRLSFSVIEPLQKGERARYNKI